MEKYLNNSFDDNTVSEIAGKEVFARFARDFKRNLKKNLEGHGTLVEFNKGHFYVSGFVDVNGKLVYFSVSDVRYFRNSWYNHILIRTAEHLKDYTGGANNYTTWKQFARDVKALASH